MFDVIWAVAPQISGFPGGVLGSFYGDDLNGDFLSNV
jgi:hypothetical protein